MRKILCCLTFLPVAALGKTITLIDDETTARQFALCFFANPFVDEAVTDGEMQVKRIGEDYHVDVPANDRHGALRAAARQLCNRRNAGRSARCA